ncbi:MAG TPA: hypothetical protein VHO90_19105 [Bacteroidales bacterium]|nr:hypothetical protein [Bacteroidales bacterium]
MRYTIILIAFVLLNGLNLLRAQEKFTKQELVQKLKEGNYTDVYEFLESNYRKFPKDPDYTYYTAVCRVQLNTRISDAIEMLKLSTQEKSFKESWFYLGRGYLLNYQFPEAKEAFERFKDKAGKDEEEKVMLPMYLSMCNNAQNMCSESKKLTVTRIDTIEERNLLSFLNKQQIKGHLEKAGDTERPSSKIREGIRYSGDNIVLESKCPFGKKYKDIFFLKNEDMDIARSKTVGSLVNSEYEESFVFFDETIPAMYFSSQGHNSAGGYDIFKSCYDNVTKSWSKPVNLGFPINTPADEIAYVTIPGTSRSLLASKRNGDPFKVVVYTLESAEQAVAETIVLTDAYHIAMLKPGKQNFSTLKKTAVNPNNEVPPEIKNEPNYQNLIHEALNLQIRSDSIRRISDVKKEQLMVTKYETDKAKLWQEIKVLDTKADEIQQKADVLYKKAREIEAVKQRESQAKAQELAQKAFSGKDNRPNGSNPASNLSPAKSSSGEKQEIHYRIQVGVFSKPPPEAIFAGFTNLYKEDLSNGAGKKYYIGLYRKVGEAEKELIKIKDAGFRDAYIIGFYNGKIVPLSRARELEISFQKQ